MLKVNFKANKNHILRIYLTRIPTIQQLMKLYTAHQKRFKGLIYKKKSTVNCFILHECNLSVKKLVRHILQLETMRYVSMQRYDGF